MNEVDLISYTDENNIFHGGIGFDSFNHLLFTQDKDKVYMGGKKPSSSTLHYQQLALPTSLFFIPSSKSIGGRNTKYDTESHDNVIEDDLYDKLFSSVEVKRKNMKKQTRKQSEVKDKKTRKVKEY